MTPKHALISENNKGDNILTVIESDEYGLGDLATLYLQTYVGTASARTFKAKQSDLKRFLTYYTELLGHDRPREWFNAVTKGFCKHLVEEGLAQSSIVRIYATVRHFARWLHRKLPDLFPLGCPTDGVKPPTEPDVEWKGLTRREEVRLINAAQTLPARPGRGRNNGLRNHALFMVLLGSGLRVSEVLGLGRDQYKRRGFTKVRVKGGHVRDQVPLHREAREVLEVYLAAGEKTGALFPTRTGKPLKPTKAREIINRIAAQANASLPEEEHIHVTPHILRHTFLRKIANEKSVHYALEAAGHRSDRYIWRYVKPDRQTLAEAIDELE